MPPRGVQGPFETGAEAAANDLLDAQFLAWTGRRRGVLERLFGFLRGEAVCGDEASESVGGPVEDVGEACSLDYLAASLNWGEDSGKGTFGLDPTAAGGKDSLPGARWDGAGSGNGRCGQVAGAVQLLGEPQRKSRRLANLTHGSVGAVVCGGTRAMM